MPKSDIRYGYFDSPVGELLIAGDEDALHLPIVVPCHRVIGADNSLTGFGGGIETMRFLLEHENVAGLQYRLV